MRAIQTEILSFPSAFHFFFVTIPHFCTQKGVTTKKNPFYPQISQMDADLNKKFRFDLICEICVICG